MARCLVVDESDVIRKVMRRILLNLGHDCVEAAGIKDALDRCGANLPDVVFADWNLPAPGATDLIGSIRAMKRNGRPLVVYCTTENDAVDIGKALSAGADDYLLKPFKREQIAAKLTDLAIAA